MNPRTRKLIKIILGNLLLLASVIVGVLLITGVPIDFDIIYEKGRYRPNMSWEIIMEGIRENFRYVFSGEVKDLVILDGTVGELFAISARRSSIVLLFGILLAVHCGNSQGYSGQQKKRPDRNIQDASVSGAVVGAGYTDHRTRSDACAVSF